MSNALEQTINASSDSIATEPVSAVPVMDIPELFRLHHHHLLRFVQRYLHNSADAEDVVQNTFIEAMRCADRFSGLSKPSTWLFGIALNLARNQVRRNRGDILEIMDEAFMNQIVDDDADPARLVEMRQLASKVDMMLDKLPQKIRSTFEAVLDGESTYEQAAQELDIPIGTVRSRVSRVRASARVHFA